MIDYGPTRHKQIESFKYLDMLRQSVMGSDMSYNDMMEDRPLQEIYKATITGSETKKVEIIGL